MTDNELISLAAKAADISWHEYDYDKLRSLGHMVTKSMVWNPLENDGEALRLAVRLQLFVCNDQINSGTAYCIDKDDTEYGSVKGSPAGDEITALDYAATRRAIVLAAAEIGKSMP